MKHNKNEIIGRLDRRIIIEAATIATDAAQQQIKTWATFAEV